MTDRATLDALLDKLPEDRLEQVAAFARLLADRPARGAAGISLRRFAGTISREDLDAMPRAIEEACEGVDPDEW